MDDLYHLYWELKDGEEIPKEKENMIQFIFLGSVSSAVE